MRDERPHVAALGLFALCGFAVAAPIFDLLQRHPEFLIAHQITPVGVWLWVTALLMIPAGVAGLVEALFGPARVQVHRLWIALLVALTLLPPIGRVLPFDGIGAVATAAAIGAVAAFAVTRFEWARSALSLLAVAPLIFAANFLLGEAISKLRDPLPWSLPEVPPFDTDTPLVVVLFDSLPLVLLLDEVDSIDAEAFPNFAALAATSTWYHNTTAAAESTHYAVPAIVSGRYPAPGLLPTLGDHPESLFTLLRDSHTLRVSESRTMLAPVAENLPAADRNSSFPALLSDLGVLYAHVVAPPAWRRRLPPVDRDWRNFAPQQPADTRKIEGKDYGDRPERFAQMLERIEACTRPCLDFLHVMLPHVPWEHLPSGRRYSPIFVPGIENGRWRSWDWWADQGHQRHLFQTILADQMLGRLLERLRAREIYDRALVVVVSDHGASFRAGESRRLLAGHSHPEEILRVPLFIKAPGQRSGAIDRRRAQAIDILPTLAEMLGVEIPWPLDGVSLLSDDFPNRAERVSYAKDGTALRFAGDLDLAESLVHKRSVFSRGLGPEGRYAIGTHAGLVGHALSDVDQSGQSACEVEIASDTWVLNEIHSPARISGFVHCNPSSRSRPHIAIAIAGVIRTVAPAFETESGRWMYSTFVSEDSITSHSIDVGVFSVEGPPEQAVLSRASFRLEERGLEVNEAVLVGSD